METGQQLISTNGHKTNQQFPILSYLFMSSWIITPNIFGNMFFYVFISWKQISAVIGITTAVAHTW